MKKVYLLLMLLGMFAISCETSDEIVEDITDNKTEQPGDDSDDDSGDEDGDSVADKKIEETAAKLFEQLTSVRHCGGSIVITSAEGAFLTMKFEVKPKSCAPLMGEVWSHYVTMQAKYDLEDKSYVNMPIAEFGVDEQQGVITIKASGEYLSDDFYFGKQTAYARFGIMFKKQQCYSEYEEIVGKLWRAELLPAPEPNVIYYFADDIVTPKNTEVVSNSYDRTKGCYKMVLQGDEPEIGERAFEYSGASSKATPIKGAAIGGNIKISDRAFNGCYPLTNCVIGDGVTSIGVSAFYGCRGLTTIAIPDSVTEIGDKAFAYSGVNNVILPRGIDRIGDELFSYCSLANITIPDGVTEIGNKAFFRCGSLQSINIPYTVTSIGDMAFYYCEGLQSLTIPKSVVTFGKDVFYKCSPKELIIDNSIVSKDFAKGESAVCALECEKLIIGDNVERIGNYAFSVIGRRHKSVVIPKNVTSIGKGAFYGCTLEELVINSPIVEKSNIEDVIVNGQIVGINGSTPGWQSFLGIENLIIGDNIKHIGDGAFLFSRNLQQVTIPDSVISIGRLAFASCDSLTTITIPDSVTSIGDKAFENCSSLVSVTIPDGVTEIGHRVFSGCTGMGSIYSRFSSDDNRCLIIDGVLSSFASAGLTSYTLPNNVTKIIDGVFAGCVNLASLNIPDSVTEIGDGAFDGYSGLTSITLPESIVSIGDKAFENCNSLTSITIPEKVTSIGNYAFQNCSSLADIAIGDGVTSIGYYAFAGCSNLKSINIPEKVTIIGDSTFRDCSSLESVNIPESVFWIIINAFRNCSNLKSIIIPESISDIRENVFRDCTSLSEVYCKRTTPSALYNGVFDNNAPGRKIFVPQESVDAYKSAEGWSNYADDIVGYDF